MALTWKVNKEATFSVVKMRSQESGLSFFSATLYLPTKFLQPVNLAFLTIWSLFNPLAVPAYHRLSPFLAHQPSHHWKSQIARLDMHHTSLKSTPWFIPSASPVMSRHTSSFTCRLISIIITTLVIHHSFTLSPQAQNLPFQQNNPSHLRLLNYRTAHRFIFSFTFYFCLFVPCDGLRWLSVSFFTAR